jgi:hypothetical protein
VPAVTLPVTLSQVPLLVQVRFFGDLFQGGALKYYLRSESLTKFHADVSAFIDGTTAREQ